ncbi:hypothetical protein GCM10009796_24720 [Microbacterium koreense]
MEQRRHRARRSLTLPVVVAALFVLGAGVLLYPAAASWVNQAQQSAIIGAYSDDVEQLPADGLAEAIAEARDYNERLTGGALVAAGRNIPDAENPDQADGYSAQLDANGTGLMARIKIPSIAVDLPVYHGTSDAVLLQGVGHLEGTALPVGGLATHSVLTAHRGLADAELFTNLNRVQVDDTFVIEVFGEVLTYRVRGTQVVDPDDTETLFAIPGEDLVTLVTCTPLGINTQRILVTGERVTPTPVDDLEAAGRHPEIPGFPWWAVGLGSVAVAAVAFVVWSARPPRTGSQDTASAPE